MDHVHFFVRDLDRTLQYYNELFGFKIYEGSLDEGFMIIGNEDIKLCLMENPKIEHFHSGGFCHFGFHVRDYDDVKKIIQDSKLLYTESEWEYSRSLYIKDPDGYTIELSENKGGGLLRKN
ncbi:MAG: VOC family protein [Saprospiraceae bacterium]